MTGQPRTLGRIGTFVSGVVSRMSFARRYGKRGDTNPPHRGRRKVALVAFLSAIVLLVALWPFRGGVLGWWARRAAVRDLRVGAVSSAQERLAWLAELRPEDGRADVIRAACFRSLRQGDRFAAAMRSAEEKGAPRELIERETKLAQIQSGRLPEDPEIELSAMIRTGARPHDVCTAFVYGFLYRREPDRAKKVLDAWATDFPEDAGVAYMRGVHWRSVGEYGLAREELQAVLKKQPRHELARIALAELHEERGYFDRALAHRLHLADSPSPDDATRLTVARLLRKAGRVEEARTLAAPLASADETPDDVLWELGEIALELGDYQEAHRLFQKFRSKPTRAYESVFATAATLALQGDSSGAETLLAGITTSAMATSLAGDVHRADRLFRQFNTLCGWIQRVQNLKATLAANPSDHSAARGLRVLTSEPVLSSTPQNGAGVERGDESSYSEESGRELYTRHCAACHGADGDGNGRAARHLHPRPTNLRSGNYRLIRTLNRVPTLQDVEAAIERGMPGTSMPPFENLSPSLRTLLAREVLRLYREGIRDQVVAWLSEEGEEIDEDEIRLTVEEWTTPGEVVTPPEIGPPLPQAIAQGRELYDRLGCFHCHGDEGRGPSDTLLSDEAGRPTSSRDLVQEPLKGGDEPEAIYLRLLLGMPGTPHPACQELAEDKLVALVQFCRSLRREPVRNLTNYERMIRATRPHIAGVGNSP